MHRARRRNARVLKLGIALPFDTAELAAIVDYQRIPDAAQEEALRRVLPQALKRQLESEQERVVGWAVDYTLSRSEL